MDESQDLIVSEERDRLSKVQKVIKEQLDEVESALYANKSDILEQKRYLWENLYDMDPQEISANRMNISMEFDNYEAKDKKRMLLIKLQDSTYFGRIDFVYEGETDPEAMYIGLGGLFSKKGYEPLIYDWRAPISSMYYDFDIGSAHYDAPMGTIQGQIVQKRQMKIRKGVLEYALNSDIKVDDEILQKELSGSGSTKMRNIVATIQKEQNSIVRDQASPIMIVQGVAGSGKTSIALHRIAFLLYQNRKNMQSTDVLIISPNNIFTDYVSNVLPELGEQNISEVSFDEIARNELNGICRYELKYEQMDYIISCKSDDDERLKRIRFKSGIVFLRELKKYIKELEGIIMHFSSYKLKDYEVEKEYLEKLYYTEFNSKAIFERVDFIGDRIADMYESDKNVVVSKSTRKKIQDSLRDMATTTNIVILYRQFIEKIANKFPLLKNDRIKDSFLLYEDVFPVVLLKLLLNGKKIPQFNRIKHVIVDEMQDYSMAQYDILNSLCKCNMTILGDINQVVDKGNDTIIDNISEVFLEHVTLVKMMKSYRSTYEISEFCRKICKLEAVESFERHGKPPVFDQCTDYSGMIKKIQDRMTSVDLSNVTTLAIICKSAKDAEKLYNSLEKKYSQKCYLMNNKDSNFHEGIIVTNSYMVKGLEFDAVVVPEVTNEKYQTERDRQILYIACTRALHELDILYYGKRSIFLDEALMSD